MKKFTALILIFMSVFTGIIQNNLNADEYKPWKQCCNLTGYSLNSVASDMKSTDVAVGQCGTIMVSKENSPWQSVSSSTYEILNNVIWDGEKFLAFGCNGTLVYSYDGLKWEKVKISVKGDLCNTSIVNKCCFAQYRIRADKTPLVCDGYYSTDSTSLEDGILISQDGFKWSKLSLPKSVGKKFKLQKVIYFKNHYIAVLNQSNNNTSVSCILTSDNLSKWNSVQLPEDLQDIASTDTAAVVVGENVIMKTTDGINWGKAYIEKSNTYKSLFDIRAIISVGNKFTLCGIHPLGGGPSSLLAGSSTDAKKWTFNYIDNYDVQSGGFCNLIYANNQYSIIALQHQRLGYDSKWIMKSRDGVKWFNMPETKQMPNVNCLIWDGSQYISCGDNGLIASSKDGDSWIKVTNQLERKYSSYSSSSDIFYDGSEFIYNYVLGMDISSYVLSDKFEWCTAPYFITSMNLSDNSNIVNKIYIPDMLNETIWDGNKFISTYAISSNSNMVTYVHGIVYSFDCVNFKKASINFSNGIDVPSAIEPTCISFNGSEYIAIDERNKLIYKSHDGVEWKAWRSKNLPENVTDITYGNSNYILTTLSNEIYKSKDGITWKNVFSSSQFPQTVGTIRRIIYCKNVFVALYCNMILTSPDGEKWSQTYINSLGNINFIKWLDNEFIAGGDKGTILTSKDGYNWQAEASPILDDYISAASGKGKTIIVTRNNNVIYR